MNSRLLSAVVGVSVLLVAACSKGKPDGPAGEISQEQAQTFVDGQADEIGNATTGRGLSSSFANQSPSTSVGRAIRNLGMTLAPEYRDLGRACAATASGELGNADSDRYVKNGTYTYDCTNSSGGSSFKIAGGYSISDDDDTKKPSGGLFTLNNFSAELSSTTRATTTFKLTAAGSHNLDLAGAAWTSATDITFSFVVGDKEASFIYYGNSTGTADSETTPWAAGSIANTSKLYFGIAFGSLDYTLEITFADMTYGSCSRDDDEDENETIGRLKAGTLTATDGKGNKIVGTYSNCAATWKYNETALTR